MILYVKNLAYMAVEKFKKMPCLYIKEKTTSKISTKILYYMENKELGEKNECRRNFRS